LDGDGDGDGEEERGRGENLGCGPLAFGSSSLLLSAACIRRGMNVPARDVATNANVFSRQDSEFMLACSRLPYSPHAHPGVIALLDR
jgi:hypothetical protein